jgi:hypothetical protein
VWQQLFKGTVHESLFQCFDAAINLAILIALVGIYRINQEQSLARQRSIISQITS